MRPTIDAATAKTNASIDEANADIVPRGHYHRRGHCHIVASTDAATANMVTSTDTATANIY
eukprot:4633646-Amphidinium_carterae.1